jgi:hypothetical protein
MLGIRSIVVVESNDRPFFFNFKLEIISDKEKYIYGVFYFIYSKSFSILLKIPFEKQSNLSLKSLIY